MAEFEIKLEVPPDRRRGRPRGSWRHGPVRTQQLHADLSRHGRRGAAAATGSSCGCARRTASWVQALKGAGDKPLERQEHEVPVPWPADEEADAAARPGAASRERPSGRLTLAGVEAVARVQHLSPRFETTVQRLTRAARRRARRGWRSRSTRAGSPAAGAPASSARSSSS